MATDSEQENWNKWDKRIKDTALYLVALFAMVNELWGEGNARPYALAFLAAIFGVPFIVELDAIRRRKNGNGQ